MDIVRQICISLKIRMLFKCSGPLVEVPNIWLTNVWDPQVEVQTFGCQMFGTASIGPEHLTAKFLGPLLEVPKIWLPNVRET